MLKRIVELRKLWKQNGAESEIGEELAEFLFQEWVESGDDNIFSEIDEIISILPEEYAPYVRAARAQDAIGAAEYFKADAKLVSTGEGNTPYSSEELLYLYLERMCSGSLPFLPMMRHGDSVISFASAIGEGLEEGWPNAACTHVMIGMGLEGSDNSLKRYALAIEADPKFWLASWLYAEELFSEKKYRASIPHYENALSGAEEVNYPDFYFKYGYAADEAKLYDTALSAYKECIDLDPECPFVANNLGWLFHVRGDDVSAKKWLEVALQDNSSKGYAKRNLKKICDKNVVQPPNPVEKTKKAKPPKIKQKMRPVRFLVGLDLILDEEIFELTDDGDTPAVAYMAPKSSDRISVPLERHLEDLLENMIIRGRTVLGRTLKIYEDEKVYGRQTPCGKAGFLDILAIDAVANELFVFELKRGSGGAEVMEQVQRYMDWVSSHIEGNFKNIYGVIVVHKVSNALKKIVSGNDNIILVEYDLSLHVVE